MNNFVVSARKYRPTTFDTVVGQASITNTLKNAIKNKHLAQAFLFCGPRGVGKTTCARILAKTINCSNITPAIEACDSCDSCISFNESHSLNIYELDAASNNSVDDIRNLVEQVRYAPHSGQYKIYIIDEVHMLSTSAFNAFLKTLEEPPPYAIFILATTEKHKIIPTILSRCQIFDFNRIQLEDIALHLAEIAKKENVTAEPDALHLIAQKADGALRDSLSIFDQLVSFSGNSITYKDVIANLNILDYEYYFRVTDNIVSGNFSQILLTFNELLNEGFDGHNFVNGLGGHFRDLLVCRDDATLVLLEAGKNIREKYKIQASKCDPLLLFRLLEISNSCDVEYKASKNQRLHVELALIKMCGLQNTIFNIINPELASPAEKKNNELKSTPIAVTTVPKVIQADIPSVVSAKPVLDQQESTPSTKNEIPPKISSNSGIKTISISGKTDKNKETDSLIDADQDLNISESKSFTEKEFMDVWMAYAETIKQKGKSNLFVSLTKHLPVLINETIIQLTLDNKIQEDEIKNEKQELMLFIKRGLQNKVIQLEIKIKIPNEKTETAYTNIEKFRKMSEKNPDINHLKSMFDLDIDY